MKTHNFKKAMNVLEKKAFLTVKWLKIVNGKN